MKKIILGLLICLCSAQVFALDGWSINVGYNNPYQCSAGVNLLKIWKNFAFEIGYGSGSSTFSNSNVTSISGMGFSLKYVFNGSSFRPYVHFGSGPSITTTTGSGSANVSINVSSNTFAGLGLYWTGRTWYMYGGLNAGNGSTGFAGIGYDF